MSINSHIFHEGQLQWNLQQPPQWVTRTNQVQILFWLFLSAAAFATLCQCVPQESTTAAQQAGGGHHRGTLTLLSLPPFSPPSPRFLTASFVGSHSLRHVWAGQADDCQIENNQKMLLTYLFLLPPFFQTRYLKKKNLFSSNMTTSY